VTSELAQRRAFTRAERQDFASRRILLPIALLAGVLLLYANLLVLSLASPTMVSLALTVPCGMAIGMLFIIGHDACHNAFTASTRLNQLIGRLAFLPALHAFSLWDLAHNRTHHRFNNIRGVDYVWEPMTPEAYHGAAWPRRLVYRVCRTPGGVGLYYLIHIWAPRLLVPLPGFIDRMRPAYALDSALVLTFLLLQLWGVAALGNMFDKGPWESVLVGVAVPFLAWSGFMSFVIYLHHTHPTVKWYLARLCPRLPAVQAVRLRCGQVGLVWRAGVIANSAASGVFNGSRKPASPGRSAHADTPRRSPAIDRGRCSTDSRSPVP
jgi:acyl-lipid omega-6 desaturase (Delta-12 desaturase)